MHDWIICFRGQYRVDLRSVLQQSYRHSDQKEIVLVDKKKII